VSKKKYRKTTTRSRRKPRTLQGRVISTAGGEIQLALSLPQVLAAAHGAIEGVAAEAGLLVMKALIDEEVEQLVGDRYKHQEGREAVRWGQEEGFTVFAGRKVPMKRPRVRKIDGGEMPLKRYAMFQSEARMEDSVSQRILRGVSTRNYEGVIDDVCDGYGIQKSSVSRHWKAATTKELAQLMERPLADLDLAIVMVDGISFHEFALVVAIGVCWGGKKHVLGIWDGATENATVVTALLEDLVERGLDPKRRYLFVIDGSKALKKGIMSVFGKRAVIQRCQIHKERSVLSYLPEGHQMMIRRSLRAAWGMVTYEDAKMALDTVHRKLEALCPRAAASLKEGFEETLTIHRLGIPESLRMVLRSTNLIESIFARTRELCKNVKQWRSSEMALRWASTMLLYAEKNFRRIRGHDQVPNLIAALNEFDRKEAVA